MSHFVTDFRPVDSARRASGLRTATALRAVGTRAYRLRLAALRVRAPDTLRARVRRELRLAVATSRTE
jgi:hypothetical protein